MASAPAISKASSCDDVCAWAAHAVSLDGVGLDDDDVGILRTEKIDGEVLFNLTDAKLVVDGMRRGPREKLLAAIERLRGPTGTRYCVYVHVAAGMICHGFLQEAAAQPAGLR